MWNLERIVLKKLFKHLDFISLWLCICFDGKVRVQNPKENGFLLLPLKYLLSLVPDK